MSAQDMMIFVTGVVGRSMGGGTFGPTQIDELTRSAVAAFKAHLAPELASAPSPARPAPSAFQRPQAASAPAGAIQPETRPFNEWGGDKAYFGKNEDMAYGMMKREVDWATWVAKASEGDAEARKVLEIMAKPNKASDPRWQKSNDLRTGRAMACLAMLAGQPPY